MSNLLWIDVETTGLGHNAAVIEVALIPYIDGEMMPYYRSYVRPHEKATMSPKAFEVTGIDPKDIYNFPEAKDVIDEMLEFIDSHQCIFSLSGHNVRFDKDKLYNLFCRNGHHSSYLNRFRPGGICTLEMARKVFKGKRKKPDGFSLDSLCDFFSIEIEKSHSALPDIIATIEVYEQLISRLSSKQVEEVKNLNFQDMKRKYMDDIRYLQRNPDGDIYIPAETMKNDIIRRFVFTQLDHIFENTGYSLLTSSDESDKDESTPTK